MPKETKLGFKLLYLIIISTIYAFKFFPYKQCDSAKCFKHLVDIRRGISCLNNKELIFNNL